MIHGGQLRIIVEVVCRAPSAAFPTADDALQWVMEDLQPGDVLMVVGIDVSSVGAGTAAERRWIVLTKKGTNTLAERVVVAVSLPSG